MAFRQIDDASSEPGVGAPRRGQRLLLASSGFAQLFALARYAIIARLLGPEQLGLSAAVVLTLQFFDSMSDSGADRFLIQDPEGGKEEVQRLIHGVFIVRGFVLAILLVLAAYPLSHYFHKTALAPAVLFVALYPIISGFIHLDLRRVQRQSDFRAEGLGSLISESVNLVVTVLAAVLLRSFYAVIIGLVARAAALVVVSHVCAERRYRIGFAKAAARRLAQFAGPLMLNGLLVFFGSQGDRVVVGGYLGPSALGQYSVALLLSLYPTAVVARYLGAVHLPRISAARQLADRFDDETERLAGRTIVLGLLMAVGFAVATPIAISTLFGRQFAQPAWLVCLISTVQVVRLVRVWPTTIALALGRSGIVLANNVARALGMGGAVAGVILAHNLSGVVVGFVGAEGLALAAALILVNRATSKSLSHNLDRFALLGAGSLTIVFWTLVLQHPTLLTILLQGLVSIAIIAWFAARERSTIGELMALARIPRLTV